jgi:hypothetical protein
MKGSKEIYDEERQKYLQAQLDRHLRAMPEDGTIPPDWWEYNWNPISGFPAKTKTAEMKRDDYLTHDKLNL